MLSVSADAACATPGSQCGAKSAAAYEKAACKSEFQSLHN
jgi:hypothetical protein